MKETASAEWDAAVPVGIHDNSPFRPPPTRRDQEVQYVGRTFRASGEQLNGLALSPDGQWLALTSWQGFIPNCDLLCISKPAHGKLFVDIFAVATGQLATRLAGSFLGEEPFETLQTARWISDRHFILATRGSTDLWICDLRAREPVSETAWDLAEPHPQILGFWEEALYRGFGRELVRLTLHTAIQIGEAGQYSLKGTMTNSGPPTPPITTRSAQIGGSGPLEPGIAAIPAYIDSSGPGPFEFHDLQLLRKGTEDPVLGLATLGLTGGYPFTVSTASTERLAEDRRESDHLQRTTPFRAQPRKAAVRPPAVHWSLTGKNTFELIDDDHDGHPEFLHIQIGVDTNVRGCVLAAQLSGPRHGSLMPLTMRESESPGLFSAYVPGSELYFTFGDREVFNIERLRATCGETETTFGWLAWEDQKIQIPTIPVTPPSFQAPFVLTVREIPQMRRDRAEFWLDCIPRAPLRFPVDFESDSGSLPVNFEPPSGPCQPQATRITVERANESRPFNAAIRVFANSAGSGRAYRNDVTLHWTTPGISRVVGVTPFEGEGPAAEFFVSLKDPAGVRTAELLINDRPDPAGGCHLTDYSDNAGDNAGEMKRRLALDLNGSDQDVK